MNSPGMSDAEDPSTFIGTSQRREHSYLPIVFSPTVKVLSLPSYPSLKGPLADFMFNEQHVAARRMVDRAWGGWCGKETNSDPPGVRRHTKRPRLDCLGLGLSSWRFSWP